MVLLTFVCVVLCGVGDGGGIGVHGGLSNLGDGSWLEFEGGVVRFGVGFVEERCSLEEWEVGGGIECREYLCE